MRLSTLVEMRGIAKSFGPVNVLKDVAFSLAAGEIHALMGENGAGKSTLMKILTGLYRADAGQIAVAGETVNIRDPKHAESLGIAIMHQELNLIPELTVAENLFLGREKTVGAGLLDMGTMRRLSREYLSRLAVELDPDAEVGTLSIGQQQMIEIARALSLNARVLIMDEPTAALTEREIDALFKVIRELRADGVGIVYVSHRMEEIFALCDRISVLRDGEFVGTERIVDTSLDHVVQMMVGRELGERFPKREVSHGVERLRVEHLSDGRHIEDISFSVRAGEVVGIAGLMGAGRTEIARTLFGLNKRAGGRIFVDGAEVKITKPSDAIAYGVGFVTEDRKAQGLVLEMSVRENITLPLVPTMGRTGIVAKGEEKSLVARCIDMLKIRTRDAELEVKSLSGGNQQKVVLAKWLSLKPRVLILDEPTRGVDIGGKAEIYQIINQLAFDGVAVVVISSELPEVLGISDRILVMHEGRLAGEIAAADATQESIMHLATGGY
ncbi:sugar ABC transporter ATP-binding protein [Crenobacter caeni]|uniref:Sugar ABC transporter ATP-binding protein n=1 Tax=Crenobacter caeni TaxID=2705474 RepID=A0A6B2KN66_9NEIS|nr:sugar ABC transporter ATP-binding protein [Crenobacter caeni]NDV11583.1 sugar ABC transporter ATP-binding protein [Crenobacter caeni]